MRFDSGEYSKREIAKTTSCRMLFAVVMTHCLGCNVPAIRSPVGTAWNSGDTQRLNGFWRQDEDNGILEAVSVGGGELALAHLEWDNEQKEFVAVNRQAVFTHPGKHDVVFLEGSNSNREFKG